MVVVCVHRLKERKHRNNTNIDKWKTRNKKPETGDGEKLGGKSSVFRKEHVKPRL